MTAPRLGPDRSSLLRSARRTGGVVVPYWLLWVAVAAGVAWLWVRVIGSDLGAGPHIEARHGPHDLPATAEASVAGASAAESSAAGTPKVSIRRPATAPAGAMGVGRAVAAAPDLIANALLATARDHLARRVLAVTARVQDPRADRASSFDLIERGLAGHVALAVAVQRHRARDPHAYGLDARPLPGGEERRRGTTTDSLVTFLTTFAERVPGTDPRGLEPGDLVVLERKRNPGRIVVGIVGDLVDESGTPLATLLDPAERWVREVAPQTGYRVLHRLRLRGPHVDRLRASLDLDAAAPTSPLPPGAAAL
ncbi:MAG: hypothetical protein EXR79_00060 [Myxococcales bacterium]|nr:hypothetical protein [Myxococcales bacterium]